MPRIFITFNVELLGDSPITARGEVYQWDSVDGDIVGPDLFESDPFNISSTSMTPYTIDTGSVALTSGLEYVMLFTVSKDYVDDVTAQAEWELTSGNPYTAGQYVYNNNADDFSLLFNPGWNNNGDFGELAFTADFSDAVSTPLPSVASSSALLFGIAAGMYMVWGKRRRVAALTI